MSSQNDEQLIDLARKVIRIAKTAFREEGLTLTTAPMDNASIASIASGLLGYLSMGQFVAQSNQVKNTPRAQVA